MTTVTAPRGTLSARPGASRALLKAKAAKLAAPADTDAVEDAFPSATIDTTSVGETSPDNAAVTEADGAPQSTACAPAPVAALWSAADEAAFGAMAARRKAAGFQRRGRDVSAQLIGVGDITPNPGTVAAAIVALVAERGTVVRGDLVAAMAHVAFPHAKARPADRGWCQGYVAGCLRDGFLAEQVATEQPDAIAAGGDR